MSFEVFTRPFIAPPIRLPAKPPVLPFQDTPEQGVAVLRGLGGKLIDLSMSETSSWSKSRAVEQERVVNRQRVYQKEPSGTINRDNYVDVETMTQIKMQEADGTETYQFFTVPWPADNIETLEENVTITNPNVPAAEPPTGAGEGGGSP